MARESKIILCKNIKLDRENLNVLSYNESQMLTLVNSTGIKVIEKNNYSFIGKSDRATISVDIPYSTCLGCNYMAFQNYNYNNKWYFAFIDRVEYVNDLTTRIYYTVDIFSTWLDYWSNKACFIVREHVNDDTVGVNTIPEGLETGEYTCAGKTLLWSDANNCYIAVATTWLPSLIWDDNMGVNYGGIFSGAMIVLFDDSEECSKFIQMMDENAKADAIVAIFMVPQTFKGAATFVTYTVSVPGFTRSIKCAIPTSTNSYTLLSSSVSVARPTALDGYTPVNKKLLVYPYNYFYVTNNAGSDVEYHYEDFISGSPSFTTIGTLSVGCSIRCVPRNYKNLQDPTILPVVDEFLSYNYGVTAPKYPVCSWSSDAYTNWLTENGVNIALSYVTSAAMIAGGAALIATGGGALMGGGMIASGAMGIAGEMKQQYEHSLTPPQARGNTNAGDILYSAREMFIPAYKMTIKAEYARSIDNYFSKFGYKVNRLKVANQLGRTNWNYVQIGQGETIGYQKTDYLAVPPEDLVNINKLYQRGITIWHNHATLGDYTQTNNIVT